MLREGGGYPVDWIERIFHVSPDGGSGVTELVVQAGVLAALATVSIRSVLRRLQRRRGNGAGSRQG